MIYKRAFTGSAETEGELRVFLNAAKSLDDGVSRKLFVNEYFWKVMTVGRNGENDAHPGSTAKDDTGGFFEVRDDGKVYLTDKAKKCVHV